MLLPQLQAREGGTEEAGMNPERFEKDYAEQIARVVVRRQHDARRRELTRIYFHEMREERRWASLVAVDEAA